MRKILFILILLSLLASSTLPYAATGSVEKINAPDYFPTVKNALSEAKESIYIVMYVVGLRPYDKGSSVYQLLD